MVLFLRMEDARGLLLAAKRANKTSMFTWIAADGWGRELKLVEDVEEIALGAITVELQSETVVEFDQYFKRLRLIPPPTRTSSHKPNLHTPITTSYTINSRNIWFKEYWQDVFQCRLPEQEQQTQQAFALTSYSRTFNNLNNQSDNERMFGDQPIIESASARDNVYLNIEQLFESAYARGDKQLLKKLEDFRKIKTHHLADDRHYLNSYRLSKHNLDRDHSKAYQHPFENLLRRHYDDQFGNRRSKRLAKGQ